MKALQEVVKDIIRRRGRRRMLRVLGMRTWWNDPDIKYLTKVVVGNLRAPWPRPFACKAMAEARKLLLRELTGLPR